MITTKYLSVDEVNEICARIESEWDTQFVNTEIKHKNSLNRKTDKKNFVEIN